MSGKPVYSDCANIADFQQKTLNWQRDRITELERQLSTQQPHALKEKLRSAEARITELEMQLEGARGDFETQLMARLGEPVAYMAKDGRTVNAETKKTAMHGSTAKSFDTPLYALSAKEKAEC